MGAITFWDYSKAILAEGIPNVSLCRPLIDLWFTAFNPSAIDFTVHTL